MDRMLDNIRAERLRVGYPIHYPTTTEVSDFFLSFSKFGFLGLFTKFGFWGNFRNLDFCVNFRNLNFWANFRNLDFRADFFFAPLLTAREFSD